MSESERGRMELTVTAEGGVRFLEGAPNQSLMRHAEDARLVVEQCIGAGVEAVLLYAANMPSEFFDLSSGQAGAVMQTLRNYRIRTAIVFDAESAPFSSRFAEAAAEANRGMDIRFLDSAHAARQWFRLSGR